MMFAIAGVPLEDVKVTEEAEWEEMVKSKGKASFLHPSSILLLEVTVRSFVC